MSVKSAVACSQLEGAAMINKREILLASMGLVFPQMACAEDIIRLPLGRNADGDLTVQAKVNGQGPFAFLVNAGNGVSSMPVSLANRLRLQLIGDGLEPYIVQVGVQKYPGFRVNAADVRFGDVLTRKNMVFMRVPSNAFNGEEAGEIGSALVLSRPSILDFEAAEIRIYPKGQLPLEGFTAVSATVKRAGVNTSAVSLECRFADQAALLGVAMTGSRGVYLRPAFVRAHQLWDRFSDYTAHDSQQDSSPNGQWNKFHDFVAPQKNLQNARWRRVRLTDFAIGRFRFDAVDAWLSDPDMEDDWKEMAGFVGIDVLSQFAVAFGEKDQVWLKPNKGVTGSKSLSSKAPYGLSA
jgi:hypothetical protein